MKILVVDDSRIIHKIVTGVVESVGYEAIYAGNGQEALDVLAKERDDISLVILDWVMPVMNGLDCLRAMRAEAALAKIPALMLSSESDEARARP